MDNNKITVVYDGMDEWWCGWYKCNNCHKTHVNRSFKYCPHCGLEIDWDNSDRSR